VATAAGPLAPTTGALAGATSVPSAHPRRSADLTPLSPDRYRYQLTIGGTTLEKLRLAKDMLRHTLPSGDDEAILDRALTALLTDLARKKFGAEKETGSSRRAGPGSGRVRAPGARHVPAPVKRTVWVRDLGRCAFVGTDGRRCGERAFVEFHHVRPYAVGGEASVANIQLRCRRHNRYEARVYFGREPRECFARELVSEARGRARTGDRARVSGATDESSPGRSGTSWRDREVGCGTSRCDREIVPERGESGEVVPIG
jgi:hypothetical protein